MEEKRERERYESRSNIEIFKFLECILRDSIRHPRLAVKIDQATPMTTLPSKKALLVITITSFAIFTTLLSKRAREKHRVKKIPE